MRLLRRSLMVAVLTAGLAFPSVSAMPEDTPTMPLSEVKPGMKGYGLSVFNGTVTERFDFTVRGIVPDFQINDVEVWPWVITVQLSGGPKRPDGTELFDKNLIYGGMSGSPMIIEGRVIGGLMSSRDFNTAAQAAVTPIDLQLGLVALKHAGPTGPITVQPGAYVGACFVYGDSDRCIQSTVTAARDGHLLTTSHSVGIPYGTIALPVFEVPVADLVESQQGASKLSGKRGRPIGTAVAHGMFGLVVHEGDLPPTVPATLTINGVYGEPQVLRYNMAYHKFGTGSLRLVMNTAIARLPVDPRVAGLEVRIKLAEPAGDIRFTEGATPALGSMEQLLDKLIDQEQTGLRITSIDVTYRQMPEPDLWSPLVISIDGKKENGKVTVLARRSRDNKTEQYSTRVDLTPLLPFKRLKASWMDGTSVQGQVLSLLTVRNALPLLKQIENHDALYYVSIETDDRIGIDRKADGATVKREPRIHILLRQDTGNRRFNAPSGGKVTATVQQ